MSDDEKSDKETLFEAAERNDIQTVKRYIEEKHVPVTITNDLGQTLAHVAIGKNALDIVKYVLKKNSSILSQLDSNDYSILHLAVEKGDIDVVKYLCEVHDAKITERNRRDLARSAIHTAVQFGHLNILKYFIEERMVDVNMSGEWIDKPPIFLALQYRRYDVLEYLLEEKGADITGVDFFGENILFIAVRIGNLDFMKRLLDKKGFQFDLNWKNNNEETLVFKAVSSNQTDIVKYLVDQKRADVNIPDKWERQTCLHLAASQNNFKLCKYLIAHGANTRSRDRSGQIPVQKATDEELIGYMRNVSRKIKQSSRGRRSVAYTSFQPPPITTTLYESTRLHKFGHHQHPSTEVDCFIEDIDEIPHGNVLGLLNLFSAVVDSLVTNSIRLFGFPSRSLSSQASILQRIDPIAEDVVLGISRYEKS